MKAEEMLAYLVGILVAGFCIWGFVTDKPLLGLLFATVLVLMSILIVLIEILQLLRRSLDVH